VLTRALWPTEARAQAQANPLKVLISIEQQVLAEPFPARILLHFHNAGQQPLWLYRPVRQPGTVIARLSSDTPGPQSTGGAFLSVNLEPVAAAKPPAVAAPGKGTVYANVGLPRPRLVRLGPGDDTEEHTIVGLTPAMVEENGQRKPLWGTCRLSVTYSASFTNGPNLDRVLGLDLWEGETTSNTIEIELRPAAQESRGSVAGTVIRPDSSLVGDAIVSLSDEGERLVAQTRTDSSGRFSFSNLPLGLYWVTARRAQADEDTAVFQHVELTAAQPAGAFQLTMLTPEIYQAEKVLHKPVLFRITNNSGSPLDKVGLEITWSNGTILDSVKGQTGEDGTVPLNLIPGRNFVTLKRRGCRKQDERADVAAGDGADGFKFSLDCGGK
jgi:hypothetical protein